MAVCECDSFGFKIMCILMIGVVFLVRFEEVEAVRVLEGEKWLQRNLVIQTLPRGTGSNPGQNPCSNVPRGHGRCTLADNEVKNVGGHAVAHAPEPAAAFPDMNMFRFGAASKEKNDHYQKQLESSS